MRKSILVSFAVLFAAIVAIGCKRTPKEYVYDVYVVGTKTITGGAIHNPFGAVLWKNGEASVLADGGASSASASSVFVSGNDVYVAGIVGNAPMGEVAVASWKNGELQELTDRDCNRIATSLAVSGSDVYITGCAFPDLDALREGVLWKNGKPEVLTKRFNDAIANSVFVSGSDVYVVGKEDGKAKLWKNEKAEELKNGDDVVANSVFVSGNDVYVAGSRKDGADWDAVLWQNDELMELSDGADKAYAQSVFVSGSDVYVVGREIRDEKSVAVLWTRKGGSDSWEARDLSDGKRLAGATSVFVIDNHVYVAGYDQDEDSGKLLAMLWTKKAGSDSWEAKRLTHGNVTCTANSVYVVKRAK